MNLKENNPSLKFTVPFFIVVFTSCVSSTLLRTSSNTSKVCLPSEAWASCSHQVTEVKAQDELCRVQRWGSKLKDAQESAAGMKYFLADQWVHLQVYRHQASGRFYETGKFYKTAFNLTVTGLPAESMNFCYADPLLPESTVCVTYRLNSQYVNKNFTLWYDCVSRDRGFEGAPYLLNVNLGAWKSEFHFVVPKEENLDRNPVFLYIYFAASRRLTATFQANSNRVTKYQLRLVRWGNDTSQILEEKAVDLSDPSSFIKMYDNLVTVAFDAELSAGNYSVVASCEDSACRPLSSPFVIIISSNSSAVIFLVIAGTGITLLGTAIYFYMNYRRGLTKQGHCATPALALLYDPVSRLHCDQVRAVRLLLQKFYRINVLLDILHVPETDHKDPVRWYSSVIARAEYVAVVIPPPVMAIVSGSVSVYQNTFNLAVEFLCPRLAKSVKSTFLITLDDSSPERVPDTCRSLELFRLPKDIIKLKKIFGNSRAICRHTQKNWKKSTFEIEFKNLLLFVQDEAKEPAAVVSEDLEYCKDIEDEFSDTGNKSVESTSSSQGLRFYEEEQESEELSSSDDEDDSIPFNNVKFTVPSFIV